MEYTYYDIEQVTKHYNPDGTVNYTEIITGNTKQVLEGDDLSITAEITTEDSK